jgi:peptide/nickel transport system substrate-binding protein
VKKFIDNTFTKRLLRLYSKQFHLSKLSKLAKITQTFSISEKTLFALFITIFTISTASVLWQLNKSFLVEIPARGGKLSEGIIGSPRFINPLLSISDADRDLTGLIYSGLLKATPGGSLVPDLAESYTISDDGLTYTFILKDNITFHDGQPLTSDDVVFTVHKAQESVIKSPKRANWEGVSAEKVTDKIVKFTLRQPYAPFLENTTMGILPKHIWGEISSEQFVFSQFNITPIGSGPYKIAKVKKDSTGVPYSYTLIPFERYALGAPNIAELRLVFYPNEEKVIGAYKHNEIDGLTSVSPKTTAELRKKNSRIEHASLPRIFAVFFNQNQAPVFVDKSVRLALNEAVDKNRIVREVLSGYGVPIDGPIPPGLLRNESDNSENNTTTAAVTENASRIERAQELLETGGWSENEEGILEKKSNKGTLRLSFSLVTSDAPELKATAHILKETWERLGAKVNLKIFETGDLSQGIIRPRKYDALLFGEIIGRDLDLFAFWHSSQRDDPGLNVALYANITADKLLEEARSISDEEKRIDKYRQFLKEVRNDVPAVFLYSPEFIYILPESVRGFSLGHVVTPSERFLDIHKWYIETEKVWKWFVPNTESQS